MKFTISYYKFNTLLILADKGGVKREGVGRGAGDGRLLIVGGVNRSIVQLSL